MLKSNQALPEPEELFLDYVQRLAHHRAGRKGMFLTLSQLAPTPHPDDHWQIVENLLAPIVRRRGGEIFRLRNGDAAVILRSADKELTDRLTLKLRYLFRDDPLVAREEVQKTEILCRWFDLTEHYDIFLTLAREVAARASSPASAADNAAPDETADSRDEFRGPHDPRRAPLARWLMAPPSAPRIMERLADSNPVIRLRANEQPAQAFELFVPRSDAILALGFPQADIERNPPLTRAFAELSARRLLIELAFARKPSDSVAVQLGLDVLLGTELLSLHRAWAVSKWTPLTFLVPHDDFLADLKRYRYVRQMLKGLGHRLGLYDVPLDLIGERSPADADILIVPWLPAYADGGGSLAGVREILARGRGEDLLIANVHNREAMNFARDLSAGLVMGRQAARLIGKS